VPWLSPAFTPRERVGQEAGPATVGVVAGAEVAGMALGDETGVAVAVAVGVLDGADEEVPVEAEHAAASAAQQARSAPASALLAIPGVDVMSAVSFSPVGSASRVIHRTPMRSARLARMVR
jgi:hypothetical protein